MADLGMKTCKGCGVDKDRSEFYVCVAMKDGLKAKCKACSIKDRKEWGEKNKDHWNAYIAKYKVENADKIKAYERSPGGRAARYRAIDKYNAKNPMIEKAQRALRHAVQSGKIIRPKICPICDKERKIQAHHDDYTKPLDVEWGCDECHKQIHKDIRDGKRPPIKYLQD